MWIDYLIGICAVLTVVGLIAYWGYRKKHKKGGCFGCSGGCPGCEVYREKKQGKE